MSSKHSGTSDHRLRGPSPRPLSCRSRHVVKPIHNTSSRACSAYLRHHMPLGEVLLHQQILGKMHTQRPRHLENRGQIIGVCRGGVMQFPIRKINLLALTRPTSVGWSPQRHLSPPQRPRRARRSGTPAPTCLIFSSSKIAAPAYFSTVQECLEERSAERFPLDSFCTDTTQARPTSGAESEDDELSDSSWGARMVSSVWRSLPALPKRCVEHGRDCRQTTRAALSPPTVLGQ